MGAVACPAENGPQQPLEVNEALKAQLSALGSVLSAGQRDTARALHLLDSLIQTVSSSRKEEICTGILAEACLTCSRAVHPVEWGPTVRPSGRGLVCRTVMDVIVVNFGLFSTCLLLGTVATSTPPAYQARFGAPAERCFILQLHLIRHGVVSVMTGCGCDDTGNHSLMS